MPPAAEAGPVRRVLLGLLTVALTCLPIAARADSTYGSVSGVSGVLYDDCVDQPYGWSVNVPGDGSYRALRVRLYAPDGSLARTDYVVPPTNVTTGTSSFQMCRPGDAYGTWTIRATLEWGPDPDHINSSSRLDPAQFTMRKPHTRTAVSASTPRPAYGQVVAWRVRSYDEQPAGYVRNAFAWVHLEHRVGGRWVRIPGARAMTHAAGAVRITLRYRAHHQRMLVRAVTEPTSRYARSTSPTVRVW